MSQSEQDLTHDDHSPATIGVATPTAKAPSEVLVKGGELKEVAAYILGEMKAEARHRFRRRIVATLSFVVIALGAFFIFGGAPIENVQVEQEPTAVLPLSGNSGVGHVAIIPIIGDIDGDLLAPPGFENTTLYLKDALELVESKKDVAAVILYITSNGGGAVASAQSYRVIKDFKAKTKIPVYSYVPDHAYSGGYYIALGGDKIIMDPEASLGNIGVIMRLFNTSKLGSWVGVGEEEISTGPRKNTGSQWKEMSKGDRAMLQHEVDQAFKRFAGVVSESRKIPIEILMKESKEPMGRTSGAWFGSEDAVALQLADKALTIQELYANIAKDVDEQKRGWKRIEFVRYDKKMQLLERWKEGSAQAIRETFLPKSASGKQLRFE